MWGRTETGLQKSGRRRNWAPSLQGPSETHRNWAPALPRTPAGGSTKEKENINTIETACIYLHHTFGDDLYPTHLVNDIRSMWPFFSWIILFFRKSCRKHVFFRLFGTSKLDALLSLTYESTCIDFNVLRWHYRVITPHARRQVPAGAPVPARLEAQFRCGIKGPFCGLNFGAQFRCTGLCRGDHHFNKKAM